MKKVVLILFIIMMIFSFCSCKPAGMNQAAYDLGMQALNIVDNYKKGGTGAKDAAAQLQNTIGDRLDALCKDKTEQERADILQVEQAIINITLDLGDPTKGKLPIDEQTQKVYDNIFDVKYMQLKRALGLITGRLDKINTATYEMGMQAIDIFDKYKSGKINASDTFAQIEDIRKKLGTEGGKLRDQYNMQTVYTDSPEINAVAIIEDDLILLNTIIKFDIQVNRNTSNEHSFIMRYDKLKNHLGK